MSGQRRYGWTTEDEIGFVDRLGRNGERVPGTVLMTRRELLVRYWAAMDRRASWGIVDPLAVRERVSRLIAQESGK